MKFAAPLALLLFLSAPLGAAPLTVGPGLPPAPPAPGHGVAQGPALPAWLAGPWAMERGAEWADEVWTAPRGETMLGLARSGFAGEVQSWQWLRIARQPESGLVLQWHERGAPPVEFRLAFASAEAIEFSSVRSEFPQRIRFARAGQLLTIEQSRLDGTEAQRVNYRPVETAPRD